MTTATSTLLVLLTILASHLKDESSLGINDAVNVVTPLDGQLTQALRGSCFSHTRLQ